MKEKRSDHIAVWQELADYILSYRGGHLSSNRKVKRSTNQYNTTARRAARTLEAGMMTGITSPARKWFKLKVSQPAGDSHEIKQWLKEVEDILYEVIQSSSLYNKLQTAYLELGVFGMTALHIAEDFENVILPKIIPIGSYCVSESDKGIIDTIVIESTVSVRQCVEKYGIENVSDKVKRQYENNNLESDVAIVIAVYPNTEHNPTSLLAKHKAFASKTFEANKSKDNKHLKESGFDEFPFMIPRWEVSAGDPYPSDCPAMIAIGEVKSLKLSEMRTAQAVDRVTLPTLQAPTSLENQITDGVGFDDIVFVDDMSSGGLRSIYDYRPDIGAMASLSAKKEDGIEKAFFVDLFLMLATSDRRQITATEVDKRYEEKLLMLGSVLERLQNELLTPLIDRIYGVAFRAGILPEPPEELNGEEFGVDYVSVLAQAQKLVAIGGIERVTRFIAEMASLDPSAIIKLDVDSTIDEYSKAFNVSPSMIRSNDDVDEIKQQQAEQAEQAQQLESMDKMAGIAQKAAGVDVNESNLVTDAMRYAGFEQ